VASETLDTLSTFRKVLIMMSALRHAYAFLADLTKLVMVLFIINISLFI
jgi:hypothetical protein